MKRLKILIFIFCLALTIPLGYFVLRTYDSLAQEEEAELRFFAETLFDRMEEELARLVNKEEKRAIDEYSFSSSSQAAGEQKGSYSPLSEPPREGYILGYFQNEPDGSFQTPLVENKKDTQEQPKLIAQLDAINKVFNRKVSASSQSLGSVTSIQASI